MRSVGADRAGLSRVLLVEDHDDTRQMYAEFLATTFDVLTAADGEEALEIMRIEIPDVLVTDLSLPGMDGFELIEKVRSDRVLHLIPVICLSGYGGYEHEQRARAAGSDRILQKPCMPDELAAIVSDAIERAANRRKST